MHTKTAVSYTYLMTAPYGLIVVNRQTALLFVASVDLGSVNTLSKI